jgi:hypothetical protein
MRSNNHRTGRAHRSPAAVSPGPAEPAAARHTLLGLAARLLTSWGHTARAIALLVTLLGLLIIGVGLMQITVDVGPVHISGRSDPAR